MVRRLMPIATTDTRYNAGSIFETHYRHGRSCSSAIAGSSILTLTSTSISPLTSAIRNFRRQPITPRMLLMHQSGLAHFTPTYFAYQKSDELLRWEEAQRGTTIYGSVDPMAQKPDYPTFMAGYFDPAGDDAPQVWTENRPGASYSYSSPAYDLLGYLVEAVSGQPLEDYLRESIFAPLGMKRQRITWHR